MTSQQQADTELREWQALRSAGYTPEQRLEALMADFFECDCRYRDTLDAIAMEMAR